MMTSYREEVDDVEEFEEVEEGDIADEAALRSAS
jgi:hypothetical protein